MPTSIAPDVHELLFTGAHTVRRFSPQPVSAEQIQEVYEAVRWAPTSMNSQPLRLALLSSADARQRLVAHLRPGNQTNVLAAPLTIVTAYDPDFHEYFDVLAPGRANRRQKLAGDEAFRHRSGHFSGLLQVGYFLLGLRAGGLQVGPMTGFDAAGVDAEFFSASGWRSLVVLNVGHAAAEEPEAMQPRAGRLEFTDASVVL